MTREKKGKGLLAGDLVKRLRIERGWTQTELAAKIGSAWDANRVSRIENGKLSLTRPVITSLALAFGVRPERLYLDSMRQQFESLRVGKIGRLLDQMDRELEKLLKD
jgi:transcriptional regulator with XRE-family HTH domain